MAETDEIFAALNQSDDTASLGPGVGGPAVPRSPLIPDKEEVPQTVAAAVNGARSDDDYSNDPIMKAFNADQAKIDALEKERKARMDPLYRETRDAIRAPTPRMEPLEKAPKAPKQEIGKGAMEYMQMATLLGALGGVFARRGATTALTAFSGAIKGFTEGNAEVWKAKSQEWRQASEETIQNNQAKLDSYKEILANKKMNIDQKMEELKIVASQYGDEITYNLAHQKNYTAAIAAIEKQREVTAAASDKHEHLQLENQKLMDDHEQRSALDREALTKIADRAIDGDPTALTAMGRSQAQLSKIQNRISERMEERGLTVADMEKNKKTWTGDVSYQRTAGTQGARVESATNEVEQLIPQAIETSRKLPRGKFVPWNHLAQQFEAGTSSPEYYDFSIANFSLMNAYARAMNPTGQPRITERLEAKAAGILNQATDQKAYEVQVRRLWQEVQSSKAAVARTRQGVGDKEPFPVPPNAPTQGTGGGNNADPLGLR